MSNAHRLAQARLGALTDAQVQQLWVMLDPTNLDATAPAWLRAVVAVVQQGHAESARTAAAFYNAYRAAEIGAGVAPVAPVAVALDTERVITSASVTGPIRAKAAMRAGKSLDEAMRLGREGSGSASGRQAMRAGRDVVREMARSDKRTTGKWARVSSGNGCDFCEMLADRGAVYSEDTADFETHDHCSCSAEPEFNRS